MYKVIGFISLYKIRSSLLRHVLGCLNSPLRRKKPRFTSIKQDQHYEGLLQIARSKSDLMDALGPVQTNRCHVVILMRIVELRSLERVAQSCLVLRAVLCSSRYLLCCCQMTKSLHLSCLISVPHAFELSLSLLGRSYSSPFVSDIQSMSSVKCRL